jgi:hypothetical protein
MSAYMVDREHIRALVHFATRTKEQHQTSAFRIWWSGNWHGFDYGDPDHAAQLGAELWTENRRSIEARYPDCAGSDDLPGKIGEDWVYGEHHRPQRERTPVEILMACAGFAYQACETDDWDKTKAHAIIDAIKEKAIRKLPGYGDADWTISDPPTENAVSAR